MQELEVLSIKEWRQLVSADCEGGKVLAQLPKLKKIRVTEKGASRERAFYDPSLQFVAS